MGYSLASLSGKIEQEIRSHTAGCSGDAVQITRRPWFLLLGIGDDPRSTETDTSGVLQSPPKEASVAMYHWISEAGRLTLPSSARPAGLPLASSAMFLTKNLQGKPGLSWQNFESLCSVLYLLNRVRVVFASVSDRLLMYRSCR
jgi:hypothetical protein